MMLFFTLFGAATPARSIIEEQQLGTLPRLFTTPTPRSVILAGKYIAVFAVVLLQTVILLIAGRLLFGAHWGAIGPVVALVITGALVASSLGLLTVSFAKTPAQAGAGGAGIFVFLGLISGNFTGNGQHRRRLCGRPSLQPARVAARRVEPRDVRRLLGEHRAPRARGPRLRPGVLRDRYVLFQKKVRVNRAWRIAAKELLQTRRDRLAAVFTIILPIVFTIFLGVIIGSSGGERSLPVAVVDQDLTQASQQLRDRLEASPLIALKSMTADKIDTAVEDQSVAAALIIPKGFGAALDGSQPLALPLVRLETSTGAQSVAQAVQTAVSELNSSLLAAKVAAEQVTTATEAAPGAEPSPDLVASARSLAQASLAAPVVSVQTVVGTPAAGTLGAEVQNATGFAIASTGSLVQWVLFSLLTVATGVAWERRYGLLRRLASTGVSGRVIIEGKMMGMVIITFLQQLMLVLLGQIAFGVDYFGSPAALLMTMISLSFLAASVGLLISAVFRSEPPVIATTVITAQLLAVLGGAWFPLEVTSPQFSRVAHFFPSAWIMDSLHGITLKDWGVPRGARPLGRRVAVDRGPLRLRCVAVPS